MLEICGAKDLPKWPNSELSSNTASPLTGSQVARIGWDMDPFVEVSIGNKIVGTTPVIQHISKMDLTCRY